jgi:hypothetical protein
MIQIIDNKKVEMTQDEYQLYLKIVKSYTTHTNKGEDLFIDLFETDDNGIIMFLKPPSKRQTSFEVFLFLMALMQHQHLRIMRKQVEDLADEMKQKMQELRHELERKTEEIDEKIRRIG